MHFFNFSQGLWTSTINCWLQGERAYGVAGAKAAVEEAEQNQLVESRVKTPTSNRHVLFEVSLVVGVLTNFFFFF